MLFRYFPSFVLPYYGSLEPLQAMTSEHHTAAGLEPNIISRAFISIKLWLLVAQKSSTIEDSAYGTHDGMVTDKSNMVWNELWPPFETAVGNLLDSTTATNYLVSLTLTVLPRRPHNPHAHSC